MILFQADTDVPLTLTTPTFNGQSIVAPTSVQYEVFDESDTSISAKTNVPGYVDGATFLVVIPASFNSVIAGTPMGARTVRVYFTHTNGNFIVEQTYLLKPATRLIRMTNTFLTLPEAAVLNAAKVNLSSWDAATDDVKTSALAESFDAITGLPFARTFISSFTHVGGLFPLPVGGLKYATITDWNDWDDFFKADLQDAQLINADWLIKNDQVQQKRRDGVISETIGEVKMFFSSKAPIKYAVSETAFKVLEKWLQSSFMLTRV